MKRLFLLSRILEEDACNKIGFELLEGHNQLPVAIDAFLKTIVGDPINSVAHLGLGIAYRGQKKIIESIHAFELALTYDPGNWPALLELCLTHSRIDDLDRASDVLDMFFLTSAHYDDPLIFDYFIFFFCSLPLSGKLLDVLGKNPERILSMIQKQRSTSFEGQNTSLYKIVESVFFLYNDEGQNAISKMSEAFDSISAGELEDVLQIVFMILSQQRIGRVSAANLNLFLKHLSGMIQQLILKIPLSEEAEGIILKLMIRTRDESIFKSIFKIKSGLECLPSDVLIDLFFLDANAVADYFIQNRNRLSKSLDVFVCIVCHCFNVEMKGIHDAILNDVHLTSLLLLQNQTQLENLTFYIHQSFFNLASSGHRMSARVFACVLAEVNKLIFGTADPFFYGGAGYLTVDWVSAFGHIIFLEMLLRVETVALGPIIPRKIACYEGDLANRSVIEFLQHNGFEFISPTLDQSRIRRWQMTYVCGRDNTIHYFMDYFNTIQHLLLEKDIKPVLQLPPEWIRDGNQWLASLGVALDQPVCVFHCRESSFWTNLYNAFLNARNAEIQSYMPSLEFLLERGYTVFRIGDQVMTQLGSFCHPRFFDLTRNPDKPMWLDFYLLYRAQLFLGTNSGPAGVANLFGTPCLLTNWFPLHVHIPNLNKQNLIVPKLVKTPTGIATLEQMLADPLSSTDFVAKTDLQELYPLSPQELLDATAEMVSRLAGEFQPSLSILELEKRLQETWNRFIPWALMMPHSFIGKYGHALLDDQEL